MLQQAYPRYQQAQNGPTTPLLLSHPYFALNNSSLTCFQFTGFRFCPWRFRRIFCI